MAVVYFDASALVKLLVEEDGSDIAARIWDGCDAPLSSRLAYAEVHAALAAAHRNHKLTTDDLDRAAASFDGYWACLRPVELTMEVERIAGRVARSHALRGADAVHLASALVVGDPDLVMAVWDRRLASGAQAGGIAVSPGARPEA